MATLQSGKCFTVPTFFGMCCRSEWQERMYIYKWHEVDQTKHEIFCVHIVCNEIQVKVNLEITTFFFYLRFPYCPNFFWFGVVEYNVKCNLFLWCKAEFSASFQSSMSHHPSEISLKTDYYKFWKQLCCYVLWKMWYILKGFCDEFKRMAFIGNRNLL